MAIFVPPGGFAGAAQMTAASRNAWTGGRTRKTGRKKARARTKKRGVSTRKRANGRKLKFGSPAWRKKYMKR